MAYIFDTHYGHSSLADEQSTLVIEWDNGDYEKTKFIHLEGAKEDARIPSMDKKIKQMEQYIKDNYAELI